MTSRIKKIIAREGLIILSFVGISLLIILTPDLYIKPKPIDLLAGVTSAEDKSIDTLMQFRNKYSQYNDLDNLTLAEKLASKYPEYEQVYKDFQKINERNKNKTNIFDVSTAKPDKRDYYAEEIEGKSSPQYQGTYRLSEVEKAEQQKEKVKTFGFNFFIFGYLAYLLVRFIFWAIRTLKQKDVR